MVAGCKVGDCRTGLGPRGKKLEVKYLVAGFLQKMGGIVTAERWRQSRKQKQSYKQSYKWKVENDIFCLSNGLAKPLSLLVDFNNIVKIKPSRTIINRVRVTSTSLKIEDETCQLFITYIWPCNSSAKVIFTNTSMDRARITPASFIDKNETCLLYRD